MKKYIFGLFVISLLFVACGEDPSVESSLLGKWELTKINDKEIPSVYEGDFYTFNSDGSGLWEFYDNGNIRGERFDWASFNGGYLELTYSDGVEESYYYRFRGEELELSHTAGFEEYMSYKKY